MNIHFYKYHGAGNDFILIDNRDAKIELSKEQIAFLCHRNFGIGADGLMLLEKHPKLDFNMRYFNSDGSEGMMCGNGGRCIVRFASDRGIIYDKTNFNAPDGEHSATLSEDLVRLKMTNVSSIDYIDEEMFIETGAPHYILFTNELMTTDVYSIGKSIRYNSTFKEKGTNVDFVEIIDGGIAVRTYERGVEGETLACGTGIVASAIGAYYKNKKLGNSIAVKAMGGDLKVDFTEKNLNFTDIWLTGPAKFVFDGEIEI
jgi:diaminopimelate epimerase